jgi:hypothetical protein
LTLQPLQAGPAPLSGPAPPNAAPLIALRRSVARRGATGAFILIAVAAVQVCLAARPGALQAARAALAALALLTPGAWRHSRAEPGALKIGPDGVAVWNRAGAYSRRVVLPAVRNRAAVSSSWRSQARAAVPVHC